MEKFQAVVGVIFDAFAYVLSPLFRFMRKYIGWIFVVLLVIFYVSMSKKGEEEKESSVPKKTVKEMSVASTEQIDTIAAMLEQMRSVRKQNKLLFAPDQTAFSSLSCDINVVDKDYAYWLNWAKDKEQKALYEKAAQLYGAQVDAELARYPETRLTREIILAMIAGESGCDTGAIGDAGEIGLMQIKPSTAAHYGCTNPRQLKDPVINIQIGIAYLVDMEKSLHSVPAALVGYNSGEQGARDLFARNPGKGLSAYDYVEKTSAILEVSGRKSKLL